MHLNQIINKKSDFAAKQVGDELVLVPMKDNVAEMNEMFTLNEVGAFIWQQLDDGISRQDLTRSLVQEFDIDVNTAAKDLDSFLAQLQEMMNG